MWQHKQESVSISLDPHRGWSLTTVLSPPPHGKRVWHTSSHFLFLLTWQFRILDYQSDSRHVILSCERAPLITVLYYCIAQWMYSIGGSVFGKLALSTRVVRAIKPIICYICTVSLVIITVQSHHHQDWEMKWNSFFKSIYIYPYPTLRCPVAQLVRVSD